MRLFCLRKDRNIQSAECFKTSTILNATVRESYFKLKVYGQAATSQTVKQPNVEVGSEWVYRATDLEKYPVWISRDEAPFQ